MPLQQHRVCPHDRGGGPPSGLPTGCRYQERVSRGLGNPGASSRSAVPGGLASTMGWTEGRKESEGRPVGGLSVTQAMTGRACNRQWWEGGGGGGHRPQTEPVSSRPPPPGASPPMGVTGKGYLGSLRVLLPTAASLRASPQLPAFSSLTLT